MQDVFSTPTSRSRAGVGPAGEWLRLAALVGALFLLGFGGDTLRAAVKPPQPGDAELSGAGWEGRRLIAQFLWLKTHAVLHAGVEERDARPGERLTRAGEFHQHGGHGDGHGPADDHGPGEEHAHEDGDGHGDGGHVLAIPPANEDFRGVLGDLEREVKPYKDRQGRLFSKDADQTVPFYRMMTWADPHFIQGYTVGATFIARAGKYADRGLEFLKEGERYNPQSFEIQTELGRFYLVYKKDYPTAERHLQRAIALIPRGRKLTDLEDDSRMDAFHWNVLNYVEWSRPEEALRAARLGLHALGNDRMLKKVILRGGHPVKR